MLEVVRKEKGIGLRRIQQLEKNICFYIKWKLYTYRRKDKAKEREKKELYFGIKAMVENKVITRMSKKSAIVEG